jgi:hypothetical protein
MADLVIRNEVETHESQLFVILLSFGASSVDASLLIQYCPLMVVVVAAVVAAVETIS